MKETRLTVSSHCSAHLTIVWYSLACYSIVQYSTVQYSVAYHSTTKNNRIQRDVMLYSRNYKTVIKKQI